MHTDLMLIELVVTTEGKTDCKKYSTDDWGGDERVLPPDWSLDSSLMHNRFFLLARSTSIKSQRKAPKAIR